MIESLATGPELVVPLISDVLGTSEEDGGLLSLDPLLVS